MFKRLSIIFCVFGCMVQAQEVCNSITSISNDFNTSLGNWTTLGPASLSNNEIQLNGVNGKSSNLDSSIETSSQDLSGITEVKLSFDVKMNQTPDVAFQVTYSLNGGSNWLLVGSYIAGSSYVTVDETITANFTSNTKFAFDMYGKSGEITYIDNVVLSVCSIPQATFNSGTLTVKPGKTLTAKNITLDGSANIIVESDQTNSGMFIFNGTVTSNSSSAFTYKRNIPTNQSVAFSSPVKNQSVATWVSNNSDELITFAGAPALASYKPEASVNSRWDYYNSNNSLFDTNFLTAKTYATKTTTSSSGILTFTGDAHDIVSDSITISLNSTNSGNTWRGIGNPWMSYLPGAGSMSNAFITENSSILDDAFQALYVLDNGGWTIINNTSSDYYIAPGQAFFIRLKENQNTNLSFPRSNQTIRTESEVFYKKKDERSEITLYIENDDKVAKTNIYYYWFGSEGINPGYDGASFQTKNFDIKTKLAGEDPRDLNFDIQVLSNTRFEEQIVPISLSSKEDQLVYFRIEHEMIPAHLEIYLEDRLNGQYHNLKKSRALVDIKAGENSSGRFYLHTKVAKFWEDDSEEDINDITDAVGSKAFDFFNLKDNILHFEGVNGKEQVKVNLFNLNGNKVFSTAEDLDTANNAIQLPYTLSEGVYIVELYRASGKKITKKIIVR